ncbi:MAG: hypothetical protein V4501_02065 [Pseudomonadota bacterium]
MTSHKISTKRLNWNRSRKELKSILKVRSELLCNLYTSAVKVYNSKTISNHINLSSHSLREIMHKLPGELIVKAERDGMHLKPLAINLKSIWNKKINKEYYRDDVTLTEYALKQIKNFLIDVETFFDDAETILEIKEELSLAIIHHLQNTGGLGNISDSIKKKQTYTWKKLWEYFVKLAHHDDKQKLLFIKKLQMLEKLLLDLLRPRTFTNFKKIKTLITKAGKSPSKSDVQVILDVISNDEEEKYFYKMLKPVWLSALTESNVFKAIPMIVHDKKSGVTKFPDWPPIIFLKNIVKKHPKDVLKVLLNLPTVKNSRIFEDLMDVIIDMPPEQSMMLEKIITQWFNDKNHFQLFAKTGNLVSVFFASGYDKPALALCMRMFDIINSKHANKIVGFYAINEWEYDDVLSKVISKINKITSLAEIIIILCHKLKKVIKAGLKEVSKDRVFEDFSSVWRRYLLEDNFEGSDDIRDVLVAKIVQLCQSAVDRSPKLLLQLSQKLFAFEYPIFCRIGLHLVDQNKANKKLILFCLLNHKFSTSTDAFHEYSNLLKNKINKLSSTEKNNLFEKLKSLVFDSSSENGNNYRRFRIFCIIKDHLKGKWKKFYTELSKKYKEEKDPDFLFDGILVEEVKPKSDISLEELTSKNIAEFNSYLHSWLPPENERFGEYSYGLSQILEEIVIQRPMEITHNLSELKLQNGTLVQGLIRGYFKLVTNKLSIDWALVLRYIEWIVIQNNNLLKPDEYTDSGWRGAKDAAFKLIVKGFNSKQIPICLKNQVWSVIISGIEKNDTNDSASSNENKNYYISAINDPKGVAFECAIQYGLWVMQEENINPVASSYQNYPELFVVLEKYLDLSFSKSRKIRAVYGRWLYWIYHLDSTWLGVHSNVLFPNHVNNKKYLNALWISYLLYGDVSLDLFPIIESQYLRSITELSNAVVDKHNLIDRIIGHIVNLYLGGCIKLNSELIKSLYEQSSAESRGSIINTMGRHMTRNSVNEAMRFWEFRVEVCNQQSDWDELIDFGWWVKSGILPIGWVLQQIIVVLRKAANIDPAYMVIQEIEPYAAGYPEMIVEIIALVVNNRIKDHGIYMWEKYIHPVIPVLLKSKVQSQTIDIIHKLGALGFTDFGKYLDDLN